ncbi:MAG: hypothetical protein RLZZ28_1350, partial [Bacteroidota bacterium]
MKKQLSFIVILLVAVTIWSCNGGGNNQTQQAENKTIEVADGKATMYYGGDIITMEGDGATYEEAVVTKDGKIIFVGNKD